MIVWGIVPKIKQAHKLSVPMEKSLIWDMEPNVKKIG
jgi:hypothetical protein